MTEAEMDLEKVKQNYLHCTSETDNYYAFIDKIISMIVEKFNMKTKMD